MDCYVVEMDGTTTTAADTSLAAMPTDGTTSDFTVGATPVTGLNPFIGQIDEFAVYDTVLTAAQITALGVRTIEAGIVQDFDIVRNVT